MLTSSTFYPSAFQLVNMPSYPPSLTYFHSPSPPHFLSPHLLSYLSSQTVSQSITRKSLCVVFGRTLFSATICLLLLSLSVSLSLSLSSAKATHWRSFFLLLLLKSWKPCEVVWLCADGCAETVVSACLCVCVVWGGWRVDG